MNPTVARALERNLAALKQKTKTPIAPLGWGVDLSCITDCDARFSTVDPFSEIGIAQACVRRLITPLGTLIGAPDYGFDLAGLLNRGLTPAELSGIAIQVQNQCELDERVRTCAVRLEFTGNPTQPELTVRLTITPESSANAFQFVFALTTETVRVLESP